MNVLVSLATHGPRTHAPTCTGHDGCGLACYPMLPVATHVGGGLGCAPTSDAPARRHTVRVVGVGVKNAYNYVLTPLTTVSCLSTSRIPALGWPRWKPLRRWRGERGGCAFHSSIHPSEVVVARCRRNVTSILIEDGVVSCMQPSQSASARADLAPVCAAA
jgi:hypothetical protein